ncbi:hypothetical protein BHE74_00002452 [Ensete ventricosum]|nr:hypothetical protein BHE74_00002452 [Ensete ventricosum]
MWYSRLKLSSVFFFNQLAKEFKLNFLGSSRPKPIVVSLLEMSQKEDKSSAQFVTRFVVEIYRMSKAHYSLVIQAFLIGLRPSRSFWSLVEHPPVTTLEMLQRVN